MPALAIIAIIWILAHATAWEFEVNGIVLASGVGFLFHSSQAAVDLRPVLELGSQRGGFASNAPAGPSTPKYGSWAGATPRRIV